MGGIIAAIRGPRVYVDPLSDAQMAKLKEEFNTFDDNEKGQLSLKQFQRLLERRINARRNAFDEEPQAPIAVHSNDQTSAAGQGTAKTDGKALNIVRVPTTQHKQDRTLALQEAERDKDGNKVLTFEEFVDWNRELLTSARSKRKPCWLDSDEV